VSHSEKEGQEKLTNLQSTPTSKASRRRSSSHAQDPEEIERHPEEIQFENDNQQRLEM
jgi:hypothetical protein